MTRHKGTRRRFSSVEKARAVMRHVVGKEPVSDVCEDLGMASLTERQQWSIQKNI